MFWWHGIDLIASKLLSTLHIYTDTLLAMLLLLIQVRPHPHPTHPLRVHVLDAAPWLGAVNHKCKSLSLIPYTVCCFFVYCAIHGGKSTLKGIYFSLVWAILNLKPWKHWSNTFIIFQNLSFHTKNRTMVPHWFWFFVLQCYSHNRDSLCIHVCHQYYIALL